MIKIMNVLNGAIWHTYFLLRKIHTEFHNRKKMHIDKENYDGMKFPVKLQDITNIEKKTDIRYNV